MGNLPLFLLLHAGVVWVLFFAGSKAGPLPVLWQIAFVALGAVYALHSLKVRLTGRRDNEGEIPPSAAAVLAVCACFVCGYMGQENGAQRIIGLCFLWLCGYFLKKYLGNFQRYVGMSRRGTGAMPEKNIFFAGMRLVLAYIAGSLFLLFLLTRTTLLPRIAQAVGMVVRHLLRLFFGLLIALIGEGQAEGSAAQEQGSAPDFSGIFPYAKPPVWLEVLEKILTAAVALAMAAAVFGQSMTGLILDLGGFFHMKKRSFSTRKALSALVSFSGIFVMTFARGGSASLLYVLMGIGAGVLTMLQMCYNSSFAKKKGAIFSARQNALSGLLGTLAYAFVLLPDETAKGFMALSGVSLPAACLGGILAVAVVVSSNLIIPMVPALWSSLLMSAGQIITSVVIDAVFYGSFSPWLLCGALLLLAGMLLSFFSERSDESGEL